MLRCFHSYILCIVTFLISVTQDGVEIGLANRFDLFYQFWIKVRLLWYFVITRVEKNVYVVLQNYADI